MIEFEVKIPNIGIDEIRRRLRENGAVLQQPRSLHRNITFHLPEGREIKGAWMRVRDEGDKITMSLKVGASKIDEQLEYYFIAQNSDDAVKFLKLLGAYEKARTEKYRETWMLEGCEVVMDEWPFLEPLAEIEGPDEKTVLKIAAMLGFKSGELKVCQTAAFYREKYGIEEDIVNNDMPLIIFDMENPFLR